MRVLVVGSGGREHALVWKIARSEKVKAVLAAPGSDAMALDAICFPDVKAGDKAGLVDLAKREGVDLVVVGPEDPLVDGLADALRAAGVAVFGPSAAAAQLEGSKSFAKEFFARHAIPTARYEAFDSFSAALAYVQDGNTPCVVKADGLAAGKGVAMCETVAEAEAALREMMQDRRFGDAGNSVVIEEWLRGEEASYYAISDGERIVTLAAAQDHKRALDGDLGENTGGMGAYSPAPVVTESVEKKILEQIVHPAIRGMAQEGTPYQGVLYVGLMIDDQGDPYVIEFNVRFGDPETQPLMLRMDGDIVPLLDGAARGTLDPSSEPGWASTTLCVVLASGGYPRAYETGKAISGLAAESDDLVIFHAGTKQRPDGVFETAGGRVLGVTARGDSVEEARERAYAAVEKISFEGRQFRRDIAERALRR